MNIDDRYVLVRARALDDLCVLNLEAADLIELRHGVDPLVTALRGAVAEVRVHAVLEPTG